jgi:ribosomal protein L11 methyltransferase
MIKHLLVLYFISDIANIISSEHSKTVLGCSTMGIQCKKMNRYIQITIVTKDTEESDIFVARLSQAGFEGFEEEPKKLHAFIPETLYDFVKIEKIISDIKGVADPFHSLFSVEYIEPRNWNAEWEKDFEPVVVNNFCGIRAHFHEPIPGVFHDIIITPKMSFGTGHHATTYMMISAMQQLDFLNRSVLDFGTGTGVLAILASKLGSAAVLAIDSDEWSIENAVENIAVNDCESIIVEQKDSLSRTGQFDIILANINLRVILENMDSLRQHLSRTGVLIGSGVLESDEERIRKKAVDCGFVFELQMIKDNWMSFSLKNQ